MHEAIGRVCEWRRLMYYGVVVAGSYNFTYYRFVLNREYEAATLSTLLQGTAETPFQYRALIPFIVRLISHIHLPWMNDVAPVELFKMIEFTSVVLLVIAFRQYIAHFVDGRISSELFSFMLLLVLPFNYLTPQIVNFWYPWDIPSVLFFTVGLTAIYKRTWVVYYIVFALGTLNRETTCFLAVVFLFVHLGRSSHKFILSNVLAQSGIWTALKLMLFYVFRGNPGGGLFLAKAASNLESLSDPSSYPHLFSTFGFSWVLIVIGWRVLRDDFVKRTTYVVPLFGVCMLFVGNIHELRIYGELTPIILAACYVIIDTYIRSESGRIKR